MEAFNISSLFLSGEVQNESYEFFFTVYLNALVLTLLHYT